MGSGSRISITGCLCLAGVASVLLTIFADAVLLRELKRSYHTTEAIVCGIAGEGESGDALLKYLKEAPDKAFLQSGARHMAAYGCAHRLGAVLPGRQKTGDCVVRPF